MNGMKMHHIAMTWTRHAGCSAPSLNLERFSEPLVSPCHRYHYRHKHQCYIHEMLKATFPSQCTHLATRSSGTTTRTARTETHRQWYAVLLSWRWE